MVATVCMAMVAMSGQLSRACQREPRKQYLNLMSMFRPITKGVISPASADEVAGAAQRAFGLAAKERPGPVYLELPEDVMKERSEEDCPWCEAICGRPGAPDLGAVRDLLLGAEHPVVLAGAGVVRGHAGADLVRFVERWNVPVAMTWLGAGSVPFDHPLSLGTVGLRRADMMRAAFEAADLVVLVGFDPMEFEAQYWNVGTAKRIVYIAATACDVVPSFTPDQQVIGDLRGSLRSLSDPARGGTNWTAGLKAELSKRLISVPDEGDGVKPQAIVRAIRNALGREDIAVSDVGAHLIWMAQRYPVYRENTLLMSNGLIPMGVGVPWAIAAKLVHPDRKVIASVGDGSFAMTGMELMTAKELGTPMVVVVWNDGEYRLIRAKQEAGFDKRFGVEFSNPDYVQFARSMGIKGYRAETAAQLDDAIAQGLKDEEVVLVDVVIDRSESLRFA